MNEQEFRTGQVDSKLPGIVKPNFNTAQAVADKQAESQAKMIRYPDPVQPDIILSIDIESLALGPRPVVIEIAMIGYDLREDSVLDFQHVQFYPIQPQLRLFPSREIHADTLVWWLTQSEAVRNRLKYCTANEFEDLASLLRNLVTTFNQLTDNGTLNYEVVSARPQFDIVAIETLLAECGLEKPWRYDSIIDVRTMLKRAGINHKNVDKPGGVVPHTAVGDARWQIEQYKAAIRG